MGILVNQNQIGGGGSSNSPHNIGDIFYTTRTDNSLNGAVECNGSQYNFSDINGGDNNIQALLEAGKLPSVSIAEFDTMVAEQGGCDSWGIDTSYAYFRPTGTLYMIINPSSAPGLNDRDIKYPFYTDKECTQQAGTASVHNAIMATILSSSRETVVARLPIGDTTVSNVKYYCWEASPGIYYTVSEKPNIGDTIYIESSGSMTPSGNFSTINKIGYAINGINIGQIAYTPENNVIGTTYFKVPKKIGRVLVRSQKPTADNNYTWYNVYADGWCEQGGYINTLVNNSDTNISFPIEMADKFFSLSLGQAFNVNYIYEQRHAVENITKRTTTGVLVRNARFGGSTSAGISLSWQVSGYAASSEYAQSTWEYQNVQVERPMVQLFNGATDEALATCTEVLADVAGLKLATDGMIDYVVESQEPTEANGYTWYRLYKSGWVEQGGSVPVSGNKAQLTGVIELPIPMQTDKATQPFAIYKYLSGQSYTIVTAYYNSSRTNVVATAQIIGSQSQSSGTLSVIASGYAV